MRFFPITSLAMYILLFVPLSIPVINTAISHEYIQARIGLFVLLGVFVVAFWWLVSRKIIKVSSGKLKQGSRIIDLTKITDIEYDVLVTIFSARGKTMLIFLNEKGKRVPVNIAGFSQKQINNLLKKVKAVNPALKSDLLEIEEQSNFHNSIAKYIGLALLMLLVGYGIYVIWMLNTI